MKYLTQSFAFLLAIFFLSSCAVPEKRGQHWAGKFVYTTEPLKLYYDESWPGYDRVVWGGELGGTRYDVIKSGTRIYVNGVYRKQGPDVEGVVYAVCTYNGIKYPHLFGVPPGELNVPWSLTPP